MTFKRKNRTRIQRKGGTVKNRTDGDGVIVVSYNFSDKCTEKIKNAELKNEIEDETCRIRDLPTELSWAFLGEVYEPDKSFANKDKYAGELTEMAQFKKQLTTQFQSYKKAGKLRNFRIETAKYSKRRKLSGFY
jgi:hypothetical protein